MMMTLKSGILSLIICLGSLPSILAQEVLVPAGIPGLTDQRTKKSTSIDVLPDTLELPFIDDFSNSDGLPHPKLWTDRWVYVNNTYTRDPVTIGVATLDLLKYDGTLNGSSSTAFESDFLTSFPLNLDYPGRDDIWLSFFYEPMGLGDYPNKQDSLVLEFLAPDSTEWERVWSVPGLERDPPPGVDTFRQVFIPVSENRFLKKGFQFRFMNYGSLTADDFSNDQRGNGDHWNIDYVYLDTSRSSSVSALNDVSMISSLGSILKTYQSIPWSHFGKARVTELQPSVDISYRNNDTTIRNATRILKITDLNYQETDSVNGGAANIVPGILNTFRFPNNYPFFYYEADSTVFEIRSYQVTEDLDYKANDTVVRYQRFYNYYAYDDGSAENGYGLKGEGSANASVAYRFKTFKEDTLRGVKMYFNRTLGDYSQDYFRLAVWDHDKDLDSPGKLIYSMTGVKPEYANELNKFVTYTLDTTIVVDDDFYVGWIKTKENILNVGWDVWNDKRDKVYYNLGQEWVNSGFKGCLMIRPLMGKELSWPVKKEEIPELRLQVYPNPAMYRFYLDIPSGETAGLSAGEWALSLYDLRDRLVYAFPGASGSAGGDFRSTGDTFGGDRISDQPHYIGDLPEGLYIIRITQGGIFRAGSKLMIVR